VSVARRPLLTATAAGALLCALWFVPSANATGERSGVPRERSTPSAQSFTLEQFEVSEASRVSQVPQEPDGMKNYAGETSADAPRPRLADTGSVDTRPYVVGGSLSLGIGAAFVAYSVRRNAREL
jgi:hypothetical protein